MKLFFKDLRIKKRNKSFCHYWNLNVPLINQLIQKGEDAFKWNQIVSQEVFFWIRQDQQVSQRDYDHICQCRELTKGMRVMLCNSLKYVGLGNNLADE